MLPGAPALDLDGDRGVRGQCTRGLEALERMAQQLFDVVFHGIRGK